MVWMMAPAAKEEQGFEHGMCEKVEHRSHIAESLMASHTRDSERNHHETDLRDGRKASTRLISVCTQATTAAYNEVKAPT